MPKKIDPIEAEKSKLAQQLAGLEYGEEKWNELMDAYIRLDEHQMEKDRIHLDHVIDPKTWFNGGLTLLLALLTLTYEEEHSLRSQVKNLWMKRPWK